MYVKDISLTYYIFVFTFDSTVVSKQFRVREFV